MKNTILILLFILTTSLAYSQDTTATETKTPPATKKTNVITKRPTLIDLTSPLDRLTKDIKSQNQSTIKQRNIFSVSALPIFCKIEHKLAKSSKVNVMMRLGSLDYVNKLEGKN